jgi:hypothetical protein
MSLRRCRTPAASLIAATPDTQHEAQVLLVSRLSIAGQPIAHHEQAARRRCSAEKR